MGRGGRDVENFAIQLAPGVAGSASATETLGTPQFSKKVLVDGATSTGYRSGDASQPSPSPEAIQEFKVQTTGMSAEYGRTSGGSVYIPKVYNGKDKSFTTFGDVTNVSGNRTRQLGSRIDF